METTQSAPKKGFLKVYNLLRCIKALDGQDAMILSAVEAYRATPYSALEYAWASQDSTSRAAAGE